MVKPNSQSDESTRSKILEAAQKEFIQNGLRGARMQEIADRAEINKALLHYHFRNKESLYLAVVQSVAQRVTLHLVPLFAPQAPALPPQILIERMVRTYVDLLKTHPDLVGMVLRELSDGGRQLHTLVQQMAPLVQTVSEQILQQLPPSRHHSFKSQTPHIIINLMSMIWGTFVFEPLYSKILPLAGYSVVHSEEFYELRIQTITQMVLHALSLEIKA